MTMLTIGSSDDDRLDLVYAALANRKRREVLLVLSLRPASIAQLAGEQSLPAFHRHVIALEEAGLVERRKSGRVNFLALTRSGLQLAQQWIGQFHAYWGSDGETLENYVAHIIDSEGIDQ